MAKACVICLCEKVEDVFDLNLAASLGHLCPWTYKIDILCGNVVSGVI
jgi:hypothetical protein